MVLRIFAIFLCYVILVVSLFFILVDNESLDFERITIGNESENKLRIVHLSDLHFPRIHVNIDNLITEIQSQKPHIIAITGDIVGRRSNVTTSGVFEFMELIVQIAPVYYVRGNHDASNRDTVLLHQGLKDRGVNILGDDRPFIEIYDFVIQLSHTPNFPSIYPITPNLVLAGHIHGGQFRLFGRGILCPDTIFFPRYSSGLYILGDTKLVMSRGLGNSIIPWRFINRPHIPLIEIFLAKNSN